MALDEKEQAAYARRLEKYNKNAKAEVDKTFSDLLQSHAGRNFVWWLLQIGQVNTQPFRGDEGRTAFACGELNVGNKILARAVELSPDGYLNLLKEKQNERNALAKPDHDTGSNSGQPGAYDSAASEPEPRSDD